MHCSEKPPSRDPVATALQEHSPFSIACLFPCCTARARVTKLFLHTGHCVSATKRLASLRLPCTLYMCVRNAASDPMMMMMMMMTMMMMMMMMFFLTFRHFWSPHVAGRCLTSETWHGLWVEARGFRADHTCFASSIRRLWAARLMMMMAPSEIVHVCPMGLKLRCVQALRASKTQGLPLGDCPPWHRWSYLAGRRTSASRVKGRRKNCSLSPHMS